jgi:uncharacterized membrane protein YsdA (DUF1294 family)
MKDSDWINWIERRVLVIAGLFASGWITWAYLQNMLPPGVFVFLCVINAVTLMQYAYDKYCAAQSRGRLSENSLHLWAVVGGWPAATLGQEIFTHKTRKLKFRLMHWLVVLVSVSTFYFLFNGLRKI